MNELRIDPDPLWVARLLTVAGRLAASRSGGEHPLSDPGEQTRAAARVTSEREGVEEWPAARHPVTLAWWSDGLDRRHVRVCTPASRPWVSHDYPPVVFVYPAQAITRAEGDWSADDLFACACGAVGTAADIAWTGDRCGPCHDRRLEGHPDLPSTIADGWDHRGGALAFSPDGRTLIGADAGRLTAWDLTTGRRDVADHQPRDFLAGVAVSPDGGLCIGAFQSGGLVRWDRATGRVSSHRIEYDVGSFTPAPDGRHVVVDLGRACYRIEWADLRQPLWPAWRLPAGGPGAFTRDGKTWVCVDNWDDLPRAEFLAVDAASGRVTRLRRDVFRGLDQQPDRDWWCVFHPEADRVAVHEWSDRPGNPAVFLGSIRRAAGWDETRTGDPSEVAAGGPVRVLGFTPCGNWFVTGAHAPGVGFWPVDGGDVVRLAVRHPGGTDNPPTVAFSPDGLWMAVAYYSTEPTFVRILPWRRLVEPGSA